MVSVTQLAKSKLDKRIRGYEPLTALETWKAFMNLTDAAQSEMMEGFTQNSRKRPNSFGNQVSPLIKGTSYGDTLRW